MWNSRVETNYYSIMYFTCITAFEACIVTQYFHYGWGSYALWVGLICIMGGAICIMGGAHMH